MPMQRVVSKDRHHTKILIAKAADDLLRPVQEAMVNAIAELAKLKGWDIAVPTGSKNVTYLVVGTKREVRRITKLIDADKR